jgi:hypothetical protein
MKQCLRWGAHSTTAPVIGESGAMLKLVEMLVAAILVVMILVIVAIATGFLPSRTG